MMKAKTHTSWVMEKGDIMKRVLMIGGLLALGLVAVAQVRAANDPAIGTWKVNLAKSKYGARSAPKSDVRSYAIEGDIAKLTVHIVTTDGKRITWGYTARFDGKYYPITGSGPEGGNSVALTRVNATTVETRLKKGEKIIEIARRVVSADGKSMTITVYNAEGGNARIMLVVYDKV